MILSILLALNLEINLMFACEYSFWDILTSYRNPCIHSLWLFSFIVWYWIFLRYVSFHSYCFGEKQMHYPMCIVNPWWPIRISLTYISKKWSTLSMLEFEVEQWVSKVKPDINVEVCIYCGFQSVWIFGCIAFCIELQVVWRSSNWGRVASSCPPPVSFSLPSNEIEERKALWMEEENMS